VSDWSSFSEDKEIADAWRKFLMEEEGDEKKPKKMNRLQKWAARKMDYIGGATKDPRTGKRHVDPDADAMYGTDRDPGTIARALGGQGSGDGMGLQAPRHGDFTTTGDQEGVTSGNIINRRKASKQVQKEFEVSSKALPAEVKKIANDFIHNFLTGEGLSEGQEERVDEIFGKKKPPRAENLKDLQAQMLQAIQANKGMSEDQKQQAKAQVPQILAKLKDRLQQAKKELAPTADPAERGAKPESKPKDEKPSLKKLSSGDLKAALSQMKNIAGITPEKLAQQIKTNSAKFMQGNPYASQIKKEQMPIIQMIVDEIIKILSGDFSNLVQESQGDFIIVHTATYNFFQKIISEGKK